MFYPNISVISCWELCKIFVMAMGDVTNEFFRFCNWSSSPSLVVLFPGDATFIQVLHLSVFLTHPLAIPRPAFYFAVLMYHHHFCPFFSYFVLLNWSPLSSRRILGPSKPLIPCQSRVYPVSGHIRSPLVPRSFAAPTSNSTPDWPWPGSYHMAETKRPIFPHLSPRFYRPYSCPDVFFFS